MTNPQASPAHPNGEVVIGDMEHDGRVILYIIKGVPLRLIFPRTY